MDKFENRILNECISVLKNTQARISNINDDSVTLLTEAIDLINDSIDKVKECVDETPRE